MMITTMMALSPIMMIVWNYYCQKKQKVSDLIKEFAKRAKQTLVTYDNLQHRKGLGGHMIVLFALITKCCTRRPPSLPCFCKLSKQTTILFASFCKSRMCGLKMLTWITSIILLTPAPGLICNIWTSPFKDLNETFPSCKRGLTQTAGKIWIRFKLISSAVAVITRRSTKSDLKKNSVPSQVEAQVRE